MAASDKLILLIEDSRDEVLAFKQNLVKAGLGNPVQEVTNVDHAIEYLGGAGEFNDRTKFPLPSIVMLDLHMPQKDGFEFLRWLGTKPALRNLHVVVVTGVGRLQEINRAYQMGANSFLTRPIREEDLRNLSEGFAAYWV